MCQSWTSPVFVAIKRCCLVGARAISRIGPVPVTVMVRIWEGSGGGNHPVNGTSKGTVYPSHQAVAERTVILNNELSFSSCSLIGRNHDISWLSINWIFIIILSYINIYFYFHFEEFLWLLTGFYRIVMWIFEMNSSNLNFIGVSFLQYMKYFEGF